MAIYRNKVDTYTIDATPYELGIEDGFRCQRNGCGVFIQTGICGKCYNYKPFICLYDRGDARKFINETDYIVTNDVGDRFVYSARVMEKCYEKVEE